MKHQVGDKVKFKSEKWFKDNNDACLILSNEDEDVKFKQ